MRNIVGFRYCVWPLPLVTNSNASDIFRLESPVFIGIYMVQNHKIIGECNHQTFPIFI